MDNSTFGALGAEKGSRNNMQATIQQQNRVRILRNYHRAVFNCVADGQLIKAADLNSRMTGILKGWGEQKVGGRKKGKRSRMSK